MILIVNDILTFYICVALAFIFEFSRILLAFLLARPSSEANRIASEKLAAQVELRTIKSIQVELVRHSKLTRKVIKCDKELETIQATYAPKAQKVRSIFRTLRVLWPVSWFTSQPTIGLYAWLVLPLAGTSIRHILRCLLTIAYPNSIP
eukprot:gene12522-16795_t